LHVPDYRLPEMSVVLVTPDGYGTIRTTMKHLRAQTVRDRLEIVIVAPSVDALHLDHTELQEFLQFRVVEVGEVRSIAEGNAAGVRHASAPVVALAEDHSYPDPDWAAALIGAHRNAWAAVGPAVRNANPKSVTSWADFLSAYGPWSELATAGEIEHLPGHNSSYKRAILLDYGPKLEAMLGAESVLHWDLRARGYRLYLEPKAKIAHLNLGYCLPWHRRSFVAGGCSRQFAPSVGPRSGGCSMPQVPHSFRLCACAAFSSCYLDPVGGSLQRYGSSPYCSAV
jgi:Glycosyl transferase family 2